MRIAALAPLVLALAAGSPARAAAQQMAGPEGKTVTLTATVVDLSCKIVNGASGPEHTQCAQVCADKGQPLGLLASDGGFYVPLNAGMGADGENARLRPLAEQKVTVKGKVIERAGMKAIVIDQIRKA